MRKQCTSNGRRKILADLWEISSSLLPPEKPPESHGRPQVPNGIVLNGILYVFCTGCQWKSLPREYTSGSTCHRHYHKWVRSGIFEKIWKVCIEYYDDLEDINWRFQSLNAMSVAALEKGSI